MLGGELRDHAFNEFGIDYLVFIAEQQLARRSEPGGSMRTVLTTEQFRLVWRMAGGGAIPMPIQAPARGRMVSDRDRIRRALDVWWNANEDPALYAAIRHLGHAQSWLHLAGFPFEAKPIRALLGVAIEPGDSVLVVQDAALAVQDAALAVRGGDDRDWYPDAIVDPTGWSLERGGDIRLSVGHSEMLIAQLAFEVPQFHAGSTPAMTAEPSGSEGGGFMSQATTSRVERIQALLAKPRIQHGTLSASITDGPGLRRIGAASWVEVTGDGGYLVETDGPVSVRPAARDDVAAAGRRLLALAT